MTKSRELERSKVEAESEALRRETELLAERRRREEEGREREEKVWELTRQLQWMEEKQAQTQGKVGVRRYFNVILCGVPAHFIFIFILFV